MNNDVLLLTAAINPGNIPLLVRSDANIRLADYLNALVQWITLSSFSKIVFCDNTNSKFETGFLEQLASLNGKSFEAIFFQGNDAASQFGKGYAESLIMDYAVENSVFLKNADSFYKATGRIFVPNSAEICEVHAQDMNVFMRFGIRHKGMLDTRFFKTSMKDFKNVFSKLGQTVFDEKGRYLEHAYADGINSCSAPVKTFNILPKYMGISGSTGNSYQISSLKFFCKTLFLKLGLYNV